MTVTAGIDVSTHQGAIDWAQVASAGYRFAIPRATMGRSGVDATFEVNWSDAAESGLLVSAYHLIRPEYGGSEQAEHFLSVVGDRKPDLPLALDVEHVYNTPDTPADVLTPIVADAVRLIAARTGRRPLIYTAMYYWNTHLHQRDEWHDCDLWVANYGVSEPRLPDPWSTWRIWQYEGKPVPGIPSPAVDMNWFNGTYQDLLAYAEGGETPIDSGAGLPVTALRPVNVRNGPGLRYAIVGDLQPGDAARVTDVRGSDAWVAIGHDRWAAATIDGSSYLSCSAETDDVLSARVDVRLLNVRSGPSVETADVGDLHRDEAVKASGLGGTDVWAGIGPDRWVAYETRDRQYLSTLEDEAPEPPAGRGRIVPGLADG